jgi:hypothetical protein
MSRFKVSIAEQRFGFRRREARENTVYPAQMQSICVSAEAVGAIHQTVERWPAHPLVLVDDAVVVLDPRSSVELVRAALEPIGRR